MADAPMLDPLALLKGFVTLRRLTGMYPAAHPAIEQKLTELDSMLQKHLGGGAPLHLDVIHGHPHVDGVPFRAENESNLQVLRDLSELGVDSIHITPGVTRQELLDLSAFLWQLRDVPSPESVGDRLARQNIHHVSLGRLLPLDTRWRATQWPDAPTGTLDPAYEETLFLMERAFDDAAAGKGVNLRTVREVVQLLVQKIAGSSAALGQILAVKLYENLTYCHSVNVAALSLLIGRQLGFNESLTSALAEAALLHDIGKTRIPLDILTKPGKLTDQEREIMNQHPSDGARLILRSEDDLDLAAIVAYEHHIMIDGGGYPLMRFGRMCHRASRLVHVCDVFDALRTHRPYRDAWPLEKTLNYIQERAGQEFDHAIVQSFLAMLRQWEPRIAVLTSEDEVIPKAPAA
jgi:putative nucleotidyltransferase with HDIG domain